MEKTNLDLKKRMLENAERIEIDEERKRKSLAYIAWESGQKEICHQPDWREVVSVQLLGVPVSAWLLQAVFFLLAPVTETVLRRKGLVHGYEIFPALSVCMATGSLVFVHELSRHFSCKMAELEQSCYLNLSQLWLLRVLCISGADALFAIGLSVQRAGHYGFGIFAFAVYVLTPFFLTNAMLLAFISLGRNCGRAGQLALAVLAALGLAIECLCGWIYERVWLPMWVALLAAALCLCAGQVQKIKKEMEGENVCWN